jgi:hypothetical protein
VFEIYYFTIGEVEIKILSFPQVAVIKSDKMIRTLQANKMNIKKKKIEKIKT